MNHQLKKLSNRIKAMSPTSRIIIGISLLIGGALWFLPILGLWMIPLGLMVLSSEFSWARRGYLSLSLLLRKFRKKKRMKN